MIGAETRIPDGDPTRDRRKSWLTCSMMALLVLGYGATAMAQSGSSPPGTPDSARAPAYGTASPGDTAAGGPRSTAPFRMPPLGKAMLDHPHNKLIHFPIVLALVGAALMVLSRRRPELAAVASTLAWLAALGAIASYFSGVAQEERFEGRPKEWLVHVHKNWGLATAIAFLVWATVSSMKPWRRFGWALGLVGAGLVGITAFLGGIVAHGR